MIEGASAAQNDKKMQQQSEEHFHPSPSFSTYSSETLAEIAARVINELRFDPQNDNDNDNDDPLFQPWVEEEENDFTITRQNDDRHNRNDSYNEKVNDDDDDFSFEFVSRDANTSPVSADDIFYNGQIRPMYMYPLFNTYNKNNNNAPLNDAVYSGSVINVPNNSSRNEPTRRRLPLRKLMFEEREETGTSCSSSEAGESVDLEGVPEGTYCVWNPNAAVVRDRKKSSSTGSSNSKRWKLRELLLRSLSEGGNKGKKNTSSNDDDIDNDKKRGFVFGVPGKRTSKVAAAAKTGSGDGYGGAAAAEREGKRGGRKKSVLPYSRPQELVGIFGNVNGIGRNLNPF